VAHDERRRPGGPAADHTASCPACTRFELALDDLDRMLALGETALAPPLRSPAPSTGRWTTPAGVAAGVLIGVVMAGVGGLARVEAQDLPRRLDLAGRSVTELSAELVVVERGWHPAVPERVYSGMLAYAAPERLAIRLTDATSYPAGPWVPNDVAVEISDGDLSATAPAGCPIEGMPGCLPAAQTIAVRDLRPFDEGAAIPLEIVGPGRAVWEGIEVNGTPRLEDTPTVQVRTTVAGAELIEAITGWGSWRELHPTDEVVMWLAADTLVPARIEVFPTRSEERRLWELRRGYADDPESPILIIELRASDQPPSIGEPATSDARSGGFVDGAIPLPTPAVPSGFEVHRTGRWPLPEGGHVEVASWSDGRAWLMVETTRSWQESRLFGTSTPFVTEVDVGSGSVGYLEPGGRLLAVHGEDVDAVVSGSVDVATLVEVAGSLGITGVPVPGAWAEAAVVGLAELPPGTLAPAIGGWSGMGSLDEETTTILLTGGGQRTVLISQQPGERLETPMGPDVVAVPVRGTVGRFDEAAATLAWVEDGAVIRMTSETVALAELVEIARGMEPR
jgi:hypothetical protein